MHTICMIDNLIIIQIEFLRIQKVVSYREQGWNIMLADPHNVAVCVHGTVLCQPVHSCIKRFLHCPDFFLEILFMETCFTQ